MIEKQFPILPSIVSCLNTYYDLEITALLPLTGGADMNAVVYKTQAHNQSSYFIKIRHIPQSDCNIRLQELLHEAGIQQIILPIKTIYGDSIQYMNGCTLMVYPFIVGNNAFNHKLTDKQWIILGKALRQLHEFDLPSSVLGHIRRETYSSKWQKAVRSLLVQLQDKPKGDAITLNFVNFIEEHKGIIQRLVDRAEQLSGMVQKHSPPFVLCHGDIHGGNLLIGEDGTFYIVDWDDPILAPKERDLMFIGGGVGNVWNDLQEEINFYKGYGKIEVDRTLLTYYRHERIVEDIALYGNELFLKTSSDKDRLEMYRQFVSMFTPQGVVDIAFKTDQANARSSALQNQDSI